MSARRSGGRGLQQIRQSRLRVAPGADAPRCLVALSQKDVRGRHGVAAAAPSLRRGEPPDGSIRIPNAQHRAHLRGPCIGRHTLHQLIADALRVPPARRHADAQAVFPLPQQALQGRKHRVVAALFIFTVGRVHRLRQHVLPVEIDLVIAQAAHKETRGSHRFFTRKVQHKLHHRIGARLPGAEPGCVPRKGAVAKPARLGRGQAPVLSQQRQPQRINLSRLQGRTGVDSRLLRRLDPACVPAILPLARSRQPVGLLPLAAPRRHRPGEGRRGALGDANAMLVRFSVLNSNFSRFHRQFPMFYRVTLLRLPA